MDEKKTDNVRPEGMLRAVGGQKGYTLIEIVVVIVVLGIVAGVSFQIVASGVEAFKKSSARKDLYDQGRLALERMVRELRDTKEVTGSTSNSISFKKAHPAQAADNTEEIKFELNGTNLERVGDPSGTPVTSVLASNVSSFTVTVVGGSGGGVGSSFGVDNVSSGTTASDTDSSMTVPHTTGSGSNRLMLVGISYNNDDYETVTGVTYGGTPLAQVGERNNSDDAQVYIYSLVAPDSGTDNVEINFSSALNDGAIAGVVTFNCVDQANPLGTFVSNEGDSTTTATLNIPSASGELVYGVAAAEYDAFTTASSGQDEHWNLSISGADTNGAGGTDTGAPTVTMTWGLDAEATPYNHWAMGGVSIKPAATCAGNLVMVTGNGNFSGGDDLNKKTLFESWGWTVTAIDDSDPQATFDNAAANNDVMFVSEEVGSSTVGVKTRDLTIPIVDEENYHWDEMGFTTGGSTNEDSTATSLTIQNNTHYITSRFATGSLTIYSPSGDLGYYTIGNLASGITELATRTSGEPCLFVAETGAQLNGLTAPARRAGFFTCYSSFANWNSNTKTLLQRALDWAAGGESGNVATLELTLSSPQGGTVSMRTKVFMRNIP